MPGSHHHLATDEACLEAEVTRRLFARRQLLLHGPLDTQRATRLTAELMTLEAEGVDPINVSINSTGGDLPALFAVTDVMQAMHAPVETCCIGQACGTAAALVAAGSGRRRAGPHARLVLQLPEVDVEGSAQDVDRAARAHTALTEQLFSLMVGVTGRTRDQVVRDWQRQRLLSAPEALKDGFIDEVLHTAVRGHRRGQEPGDRSQR